MEDLDYWRLCDEFSVVQAALLISGQDPSSAQYRVDDWEPDKRPKGYEAALAALRNAIMSFRIRATIRNAHGYEIYTGPDGATDSEGDNAPDWHKTTVLLEDIRFLLSVRGINSGFFFPATVNKPDYLDPTNPRYAPKLAAAVTAWLATGENEAIAGKTPKQALVKWLREHAAQFRLSDADGSPNDTGIEECAKVANWKEKGGAPTTPKA